MWLSETAAVRKRQRAQVCHHPGPAGVAEATRRTVFHLLNQEEIRVNQRSRTTGHTAPTTSNDMDEALRRVQGRPAPTSAPRTLAVAA